MPCGMPRRARRVPRKRKEKLSEKMKNKKLEIRYEEFSSLEELAPDEKKTALEAVRARENAYAPYSGFKVGAAVLMANGELVSGSNQENAASPSGLCAERTAMFAAGARYPGMAMKILAVAGGGKEGLSELPTSPCGACRQVMAEYRKIGGEPMEILLVGGKSVYKFHETADLLPFIFDNLY